jgi:hypothetical protein
LTRTCTICKHSQKDDIDTALIGNGTFRYISEKYNVSTGALQRHKKEHLIHRLAEVQKAKDVALNKFAEKAAHEAREEIDHSGDMLTQIQDLGKRALSLLNQAEESGDLRTALAGIKEARGCIELLAKIEGRLDDRPQVNINLSSQWIKLRATIINVLQPYPAARQAVIDALQ